MKSRILFAAFALTTLSTQSFSAVTLHLPEELKLVAINAQDINSGFLGSQRAYTIDAGVNTISVRYTDYYEHADNSHDVVKSGVVTLTTPQLEDQQTYRLALINPPKDFEAAKKYKDEPMIGLYDKTNTLVAQQVGAKEVSTSWLAGGVLNRSQDLRSNVQASTSVNTVSSLPENKVIQKNITQESKDIELIQLWQKASQVERQKFMIWLSESKN